MIHPLVRSQRQDEILRRRGSGIAVSVKVVRGKIGARTRTEGRALPVNCHFHLAFPNEKHFLMPVPVRRMRRHPAGQLTLVKIYRVTGMSIAGQNLVRLDRRSSACL